MRNARDEDEDDCCPICFSSPSNELRFAKSSCGHEFCIPCAERFLLASQIPSAVQRISQDQSEIPDGHLSAPTLGRCPICRQELNLFDLKNKDGLDRELFKKETNISGTPLAGRVYSDRDKHMVITFPAGSEECKGPYISFQSEVRFHDRTLVPEKTFFDPGCHYFAKTNTFHGDLSWSTADDESRTLHGQKKWKCILQFSSDYRFVSSGTIVKDLHQQQNPFDGTWQVKWLHDNSTARIVVKSSEIRMLFLYRLDFSNRKEPTFTWPDLGDGVPPVVQTTSYDVGANPQGPDVGETILWKTTHPRQSRIEWKRESRGEPHTVSFLGASRGCTYFQQIHSNNERPRQPPSYKENKLWGNTFCQACKVGLASYHFVQSENDSDNETAYISYEHPATGQWPPLDNGAPVPARVPFRETSFDANEFVFRGKIKWLNDFGTCWQGSREWWYEMKFDSQFTCILSGKVMSLMRSNDPEEFSTFGFDLIYVNAAIGEKIASLMAASQSGETRDIADEHESLQTSRIIKRQLERRLQGEGGSVRTIAMVNRLFTSFMLGPQEGHSSIDFNL